MINIRINKRPRISTSSQIIRVKKYLESLVPANDPLIPSRFKLNYKHDCIYYQPQTPAQKSGKICINCIDVVGKNVRSVMMLITTIVLFLPITNFYKTSNSSKHP